MKKIISGCALLAWLLIGFLVLSGAPAFAGGKIDVLIDLDRTIIDLIAEPQAGGASMDSQIIHDFDGTYRVADGVREGLAWLSSLPDVRVSFFSGGSAGRNRRVLKQILLPNGKSAADIAFKILSSGDLSHGSPYAFQEYFIPDNGGAGYYNTTRKKDVRISEDTDPDETVLLDDDPNYVLRGQEKSLLFIILNSTSGPEQGLSPIDKIQNLKETIHNILDRNKFIRAMGLLKLAMKTSRLRHISLTDALHQLQWTKVATSDGPKFKYNFEQTHSSEIYAGALSALREFNPDLKLAVESFDCNKLLSVLKSADLELLSLPLVPGGH